MANNGFQNDIENMIEDIVKKDIVKYIDVTI